VERLRTIHADGDHESSDTPPDGFLDQIDRLVPEPTCRRKIQQKERATTLLDRRDHIVEITAHEQLAAGKMHPSELRPASEELLDFGRRHLVHALLLPDVAHLAAEVAVIRRDESDFIRKVGRAKIGSEDRLSQADLFDYHEQLIIA
jgi:hypothetical protein